MSNPTLYILADIELQDPVRRQQVKNFVRYPWTKITDLFEVYSPTFGDANPLYTEEGARALIDVALDESPAPKS